MIVEKKEKKPEKRGSGDAVGPLKKHPSQGLDHRSKQEDEKTQANLERSSA